MASFLNNFHFIRPWWLLALPAGLFLLAGLKRQDAGISQWHKVCDQHLLEQLLVGESLNKRQKIYGALLTMLLLATLALAGPTWERLPQPLFRSTAGRVIVLDLSLSMKSADISPSRLTRARYRTVDLIKSAAGIDQGLVVFAGDAFIVTPLTDDRATLLNLIPGLNTNTVPVQGSRADRGLEKAYELLQRSLVKNGQIILISDDADYKTVNMAEKIRAAGHRIDVIAVGTAAGAPVTLPEGGYLKDDRGQIVVPVPNFSMLEKVAENGGGRYLTIDSPERAFVRLNKFSTAFPEKRKSSKVTGDQWLDRGPWLLIPLLILAALSFRRGWLMLLLLALLLPSKPAFALSWQDLWQRPSQQAARAFKNREYDKAANLSRDPDWQAAALYRAGKFKEAAAALAKQNSSLSHYNRGNALARTGKLQEALSAYDKALAADPGLEDAEFNRNLVKKLLQQQKQQQKKQSQQNKSDNQKKSQDKDNNKDKNKSQKNDTKEQNSKQKQSSDSQKSEDQESQSQQSGSKQKSNPDSQPQNSDANHRDQKQTPEEKQKQPDSSKQAAQEKSETEKSENKKSETKKSASQKAEAGKKDKPEKEPNQQTAAGMQKEKPLDAEQQALKQWLRRVPDDPGGLLQRKFLYQYRERQDRSQGVKEW